MGWRQPRRSPTGLRERENPDRLHEQARYHGPLPQSLVTHRATLARDRGFRYVQVDASPDSRPILRRLGFVELATTTPYRL